MPKLNGTGPEGKGAKTGRGLGNCKETHDPGFIERLGKGLGLRRQSGGGSGRGRRLKSRK